jgi:hypothetical protein
MDGLFLYNQVITRDLSIVFEVAGRTSARADRGPPTVRRPRATCAPHSTLGARTRPGPAQRPRTATARGRAPLALRIRATRRKPPPQHRSPRRRVRPKPSRARASRPQPRNPRRRTLPPLGLPRRVQPRLDRGRESQLQASRTRRLNRRPHLRAMSLPFSRKPPCRRCGTCLRRNRQERPRGARWSICSVSSPTFCTA